MKNDNALGAERAENGVPHAATLESSPYLGDEDREVILHDGPEEIAEEHKGNDYSNFKKGDFVKLTKTLSLESDLRKVDAVLREIKPLYDEIYLREKTAALAR